MVQGVVKGCGDIRSGLGVRARDNKDKADGFVRVVEDAGADLEGGLVIPRDFEVSHWVRLVRGRVLSHSASSL